MRLKNLFLGVLLTPILTYGGTYPFSKISRVKDTTGSFGIYLNAGTAFHKPFGILQDRFSRFWGVPVSLTIKARNNYYYQLEHSVLLGGQVSEPNMFAGLTGDADLLYDIDGFPSIVRRYMRGFYWKLEIGKDFMYFGKQKLSSLSAGIGTGFLQHRIFLKFDRGQIPQIEGDYATGFDRLTNGFYTSQNLTYRYVNPKTLSLYAGIYFQEGFTKNRRIWNNGADNSIYKPRTEIFPAFQAGLIIPFKYKPAL